MDKSILISVRPENVVNILNGNKKLELRKSFPRGFIGWVYVYATKSKPYIIYGEVAYGTPKQKEEYIPVFHGEEVYGDEILNGKVVARFWFDGYWVIYPYEDNTYTLYPGFLSSLQLTLKDVNDYGKGKILYTWHINKLEIFDEPLMLSDFHTKESLLCVDYDDGFNYCLQSTKIKKAPQSWQYVYTNKGERK